MRIKQIDVSDELSACKNATEDQRNELFSRIADKLEYCLSVLNYEDTFYDRKRELHGINEQKSAEKITKEDEADGKNNKTRSIILQLAQMNDEVATSFRPILEEIFDKDASFDSISGKFTFNANLELFSDSSKKKLKEFGASLSEYTNSVVDTKFIYSEPEVEIYQDDLFEKDESSKKILSEFLDWRTQNKTQTLFTIFQEAELNDWGHADSKIDHLGKKSSEDWLRTIFNTDVSRYEYRGFSMYWHEFGDYFEGLIRAFWRLKDLEFTQEGQQLLISNKKYGQFRIQLNTFINLLMFAPGEKYWCGGTQTDSYFQELLFADQSNNSKDNLRRFSELLERYFKRNAILPKVDLLSIWESIGSFTCANHSNSFYNFQIMEDAERYHDSFQELTDDLLQNAPYLIPYLTLGDLYKNDFYLEDYDCCQYKKAFVLSASNDFDANTFITTRINYLSNLFGNGFYMLGEGILLLTITDLLLLNEVKALEWNKIHTFLERQDISKKTKDLALQLINEHPQEETENLRSFRERFKAELTESDPNIQRITKCLQSGETKHVEFKQTLSWDINTKTKEKRIEESALKAICGFLNADGGTLLIGVNDDGQATGIDFEIKKLHKSDDKMMLHFKNLIKDRLGADVLSLVEREIVNYGHTKVLVVLCERSQKEVWMDKKDFYVRSHPSTDRLEGPELLQYCKRRFFS